MSLWNTGDQATAYKMNKFANTGLDEEKGLPTVIGEAFIATDTLKIYLSLDGSDWTHYYLLTAI